MKGAADKGRDRIQFLDRRCAKRKGGGKVDPYQISGVKGSGGEDLKRIKLGEGWSSFCHF